MLYCKIEAAKLDEMMEFSLAASMLYKITSSNNSSFLLPQISYQHHLRKFYCLHLDEIILGSFAALFLHKIVFGNFVPLILHQIISPLLQVIPGFTFFFFFFFLFPFFFIILYPFLCPLYIPSTDMVLNPQFSFGYQPYLF
jgi:hypothetical protein